MILPTVLLGISVCLGLGFGVMTLHGRSQARKTKPLSMDNEAVDSETCDTEASDSAGPHGYRDAASRKIASKALDAYVKAVAKPDIVPVYHQYDILDEVGWFDRSKATVWRPTRFEKWAWGWDTLYRTNAGAYVVELGSRSTYAGRHQSIDNVSAKRFFRDNPRFMASIPEDLKTRPGSKEF